MPSATFPTLSGSRKADSDGFSVELEDPSMSTDMEGGYVISRARHTRLPRKTFSVKYTDLSGADRTTLENFYGTVRGGAVTFNWTSPQDSTVYEVRFIDKLKFEYAGYGTNQRWNCSFQLQQA